MIPSKENVTKGAMSIQDKMTIDEGREYVPKMKQGHVEAGR
jgi:hypothetical protein